MTPSRFRVLVVDDDALMRWAISETLTHAGNTVVGAPDGASALHALTESPETVDAVVLDYRLPDSSDLTLLARIRRLVPQVPVILITSFGTPEIASGARELGAYDVVDKPFELRHLETLVERACGSRGHGTQPPRA